MENPTSDSGEGRNKDSQYRIAAFILTQKKRAGKFSWENIFAVNVSDVNAEQIKTHHLKRGRAVAAMSPN